MAEPISIQQLKDASEDAITLADFIYKPANVMIPRRLAADINSLQYYLDYMSSYAQHSYETYDEMVANAVNLPNGVSVFVTNDLDSSKNGIYTYNGTSFIKGDYQPENAAKEYVEAKLGGLEIFDGKVRAQDVSTADGSTQDDKNAEVVQNQTAYPFEGSYIDVDSFELGATITQRNQALRHTLDGKIYRWAGDLPKIVPIDSTPENSGGIGVDAWLEVSDTALRQDINSAGGTVRLSKSIVQMDTVSDMKSNLWLKSGQVVISDNYYADLNSGSATYDIVTMAAYGKTPDGYGDHLLENGLVAKIRVGAVLDVTNFGARNDGNTDSGLHLQAALNYSRANNKLKVYLPKGYVGNGQFLSTIQLEFYSNQHIYGDSTRFGIIFTSDAGLVSQLGVQATTIENLLLYTALPNDGFGNGKTGIRLLGDTDNRPYFNIFRNVTISGFATAIRVAWTWALTVETVTVSFGLNGIISTGLSVNNFVRGCTLNGAGKYGDEAGIEITGAAEGWVITGNVLFGFGRGIALHDCSHNYISNNIIDYTYKIGIFTSGNSINQNITNNYVAMSDGASTAIWLSNPVNHLQQDGHIISGNEILPYGTCAYGITLATGNRGTSVTENKIRGGFTAYAFSSINVEGLTVINNNMSGQSCAVDTSNSMELAVFNNNNASLTTSVTNIVEYTGKTKITYSDSTTGVPTSGSYVVGDIIKWIGAASLNKDHTGFICTTSGVAGVDAKFAKYGLVGEELP